MKRITKFRIMSLLVVAFMFASYSASAQELWKNRKPNTKNYNSGFLNKYRNLIVFERETYVNKKLMKLIFLGVPSEKVSGKTKVVTTMFYNPSLQYIKDETIMPAEITKLIYHHVSDNSFQEWAGFRVKQIIENKKADPNSHNRYCALVREYRVDDDTANELIELLAKQGEWAEIPTVGEYYYEGSIFVRERAVPLSLKEWPSNRLEESIDYFYRPLSMQKEAQDSDYRQQIINELEEGAARAGIKLY